MVKRENVQKMDPKFRVFDDAEIVVSPQCHTHFYKNMWFYEHGFRSGGLFVCVGVQLGSTHADVLSGTSRQRIQLCSLGFWDLWLPAGVYG